MKAFILLIGISLLVGLTKKPEMGKGKWKQSFYEEVSQENFREYKLFNASIDMKKPDLPRLNAAIFYVTNENREENFLPSLKHRSHLEKMAGAHSSEMLKRNFFSHVHPRDKNRRKVINRAQLAQIPNPYVAENIYYSTGKKFKTYLELADLIVEALMDSPSHKANIINQAALELGCGSVYTAGSWRDIKKGDKLIEGFWLVTQNFQFYQPIASLND